MLPTSKRCCVVKVFRSRLIKVLQYHGGNWTNTDGNYSEDICTVSTIRLSTEGEFRHDGHDTVDEDMLMRMPELNPPDKMPNGNVGTPTLVFLDMIQKCLLPQALVKKLQLKFPKTQGKRLYANVDFNYQISDKKNNDLAGETHISSSLSILQKDGKKVCERPRVSDDVADPELNVCNEQETAHMTLSNEESFATHGELNASQISSANSSTSVASSLRSEDSTHPTNGSEGDDCDNTCKNDNHSKFKQPLKVTDMSARKRKQKEKAERRETRRLMNEGIEERLIAIERRYHNDNDAEEWDRHEASEDDPSNQERNTERLYEQEEETPWEKGGPGVVFYTDAIFWQAREGDFDEKTTDDLDVDFSPYEEAGAGDKDIKDFLKIRQEQRFRSGYDSTDRYSIGIAGEKRKPTYGDPTSSDDEEAEERTERQREMKGKQRMKIGRFEQFTKGVGRRLMERQGWRDGQGLGKANAGIKDALKADGQGPHNKSGLGYSEPVWPTFQSGQRPSQKQRSTTSIISTVYDNPERTDPKVPLLQRPEPTTLKHRQAHLDSFSSS